MTTPMRVITITQSAEAETHQNYKVVLACKKIIYINKVIQDIYPVCSTPIPIHALKLLITFYIKKHNFSMIQINCSQRFWVSIWYQA